MKEYLFLFRGGNGDDLQQSPEKWQAHVQQWMQWMSGLQRKGQLVSAQPLSPSGKRVTGIDKKVIDGPFAEAKEMVGGYLLCKASGYDDAVEVAKGCPILASGDGMVEVREVLEMTV